MRRFAALSLALLLTAPAAAQEFTILTPEQIGQIFCISRLGNDMAPVEAILTPDLTEAIATAEEKNAKWEKANPGEKPPLGDGIPWQAAPDYASQCSVGAATLMMDEASVAIDYGFPEYPAGNFTDRLQLKLVPGEYGEKVWRIDNVSFADGNMRDYLVLAFDFE
jgi:hypothetical protein